MTEKAGPDDYETATQLWNWKPEQSLMESISKSKSCDMRREHTCCRNFSQAVILGRHGRMGMDAETFQPSANRVLENENANLGDFTLIDWETIRSWLVDEERKDGISSQNRCFVGGICYDSIEAEVLLGQIATHALILRALSGESHQDATSIAQQIWTIRLVSSIRAMRSCILVATQANRYW